MSPDKIANRESFEADSGGTGAMKKKWRFSHKKILFVTVVVLSAISAVFAYVLFVRPVLQATESTNPAVLGDDISRGVVGISLDHLRSSRWRKERDMMTQAIEAAGGSVLVTVADSDPDLQLAQAKNLILQGVDVLIVVPFDAKRAADIVAVAHKAGIKVISYDRLILDSELDYYITFDNVKVGKLQAEAILDTLSGKGKIAYIGGSPTDNNSKLLRQGTFDVLQPKIDSGEVEIVFDKHIDKWNPQTAYEEMKGFLVAGGKVDAVIAANDNMAGGVIQALQENGLGGKVAVVGQDAVLNACRNIVDGQQTATVYKSLKELATDAVEMSLAILDGKPVSVETTVNNGLVDVPSKLLDVVLVTKDNLQETVIKDGHLTFEEVFGNR